MIFTCYTRLDDQLLIALKWSSPWLVRLILLVVIGYVR